MDIAMKAMMAELAPVVREYVVDAQAPLLERINSLEAEKGALAARCEALEEAAKKPVEIDLTPVEKLIEAEIAKLPVPEPVQEIDREELAEAISLAVNEAVAALPPPEKGEKGERGDPGERGVDGSNGVDGKDGLNGKDAAGIVDALKDSGELVLTLADGRLVRTGIRDGEKGADGRDGFGLDDFDCEPIDERTIRLKFTQGETSHNYELTFPVPVYRDVYKEGAEYERGDMVTWGGALWHCDAPTKDKPGTDNWTLAVKKGRDGKDAKNG
jgi:integrin beta 3